MKSFINGLVVMDSHVYTRSYLILKSKNVVKFYVHISPIFSCHVHILLPYIILPVDMVPTSSVYI